MTESAHPRRAKATKGATANGKPRSHHRKASADDADAFVRTEARGRAGTAADPLEGEVIQPRISPKTARIFGRATRWIEGMLPTADGGPAPVVTAARVKFASWIWTGVGLLGGSIAGALIVLLAAGLPSIPMALAGLSAGALLGAALALVFASRFPFVRKVGAFAILLAPLLLLAAPFLLLAGGIALLMRFPKGGSGRQK